MELHGLVQIVRIAGDDEDLDIGVAVLEPGPHMDAPGARHLHVQEGHVRPGGIRPVLDCQKGVPAGIGGVLRLPQAVLPEIFP